MPKHTPLVKWVRIISGDFAGEDFIFVQYVHFYNLDRKNSAIECVNQFGVRATFLLSEIAWI